MADRVKGAFIVYCNATAVPMYRLHIYCSSMQRIVPQVHFLAVMQCSSRCRDGNTTTATYHNAAAVDYECSFTAQRAISTLNRNQNFDVEKSLKFVRIFQCWIDVDFDLSTFYMDMKKHGKLINVKSTSKNQLGQLGDWFSWFGTKQWKEVVRAIFIGAICLPENIE